MIGPLAIIQARLGSTRLPGKMLLPLGGMTIIERVWRSTVAALGHENTVVAYPNSEENSRLAYVLKRLGANTFPYWGAENDVVSRFYHCAHRYRWHPDSVIMRITPDDPFKDPKMMLRVANGERLPVEQGGEAFTLSQLDHVYNTASPDCREHLTPLFFPVSALPAPEGLCWTVDTPNDYEEAMARVHRGTISRSIVWGAAAFHMLPDYNENRDPESLNQE